MYKKALILDPSIGFARDNSFIYPTEIGIRMVTQPIPGRVFIGAKPPILVYDFYEGDIGTQGQHIVQVVLP